MKISNVSKYAPAYCPEGEHDGIIFDVTVGGRIFKNRLAFINEAGRIDRKHTGFSGKINLDWLFDALDTYLSNTGPHIFKAPK